MTTKRTTVRVGNAIAPLIRPGTPDPRYLPGDGQRYRTVGVGDETVYSTLATMRRGVNAHSGKTWCRFETNSIRSLSWRSGRMRQYYVSFASAEERRRPRGQGRPRKTIHDTTTELIELSLRDNANANMEPEYLSAVLEKTGAKSITDLVLREYPLARDIPAGPGITPLLALPNVQDFTRAYFGKSRYRKDLVRGVGRRGWVAAGGIDHLNIVRAFSSFVPMDWIATHLNDLPEPNVYNMSGSIRFTRSVTAPRARKMLRTTDAKQMRRLLKTLADARDRDVQDTFLVFDAILEKDPSYRLEDLHFSDWKSLHDILPEELRKLKHRNRPVSYEGRAKELIGTFVVPRPQDSSQSQVAGDAQFEVDTYEIVGTPDTWTLADWGRDMNNCIGGYAEYAVTGKSLLYAVIKNGKMLANMEISPANGRIIQLVGKHNARLENRDDEVIRSRVADVFPQAERDRVRLEEMNQGVVNRNVLERGYF